MNSFFLELSYKLFCRLVGLNLLNLYCNALRGSMCAYYGMVLCVVHNSQFVNFLVTSHPAFQHKITAKTLTH